MCFTSYKSKRKRDLPAGRAGSAGDVATNLAALLSSLEPFVVRGASASRLKDLMTAASVRICRRIDLHPSARRVDLFGVLLESNTDARAHLRDDFEYLADR